MSVRILVDALVEKGHRVRILDSLVEQVHGGKIPEYLNKSAEFIKADVCDAESVEKALDGIDVVYHQAAAVGVVQSMYEIPRFVQVNDYGTAVLLDEIVKRRGKIRKLVVASSMSIYGESTHFCENCQAESYPYLRSNEQLAAHAWEFSCEKCGNILKAVGTREDKPLFPTTVYAVNKWAQENYEPKVKLEDGLTALLDWVKDQRPNDRVAAATAELAAHRLVR